MSFGNNRQLNGAKVHGKYMTPKKLEELRSQIRDEIGRQTAVRANEIMLAIAIAVLADVFGFGEVRIKRFRDCYDELGDSFNVGRDSLETIEANIEERFGIKLGGGDV